MAYEATQFCSGKRSTGRMGRSIVIGKRRTFMRNRMMKLLGDSFQALGLVHHLAHSDLAIRGARKGQDADGESGIGDFHVHSRS